MFCRKTPVKGILKQSRAGTPTGYHGSQLNVSVGEKSKVFADKALNMLNPYR